MSATLVEALIAPESVKVWPQYPFLYEINTWVWLAELSRKYGRGITLSTVPSAEWDALAAYGFDGVWFMGVWERSPAGIAVANRNQNLLEDFRRALPDFRSEDNVGSPYCVRNYAVDGHLGGPEGLAVARKELAKRGMRLVLDFVPNHVAHDHPLVTEHPEYFIQGSPEDAKNDASSFVEIGGKIFACGRDPYFPAWQDVLQVNAFEPGLREVMIQTVAGIAEQCDGIRCDMAMLMLNPIFARTWGGRAGPMPQREYWVELISSIKQRFPGFLFIAEAYWDLEWELQQQGFDFCYDKKLYDRMEHRDAENVRLHLCADLAYQRKLLRFMENHDEPRAAATFSPAKERAVAIAIATLPGLRLFHEGQFEGRTVRVPVFLSRRREEAGTRDLQSFYAKLLDAVHHPVFREGEWSLCSRSGWPDNSSFRNVVGWNWASNDARYLIVANLSDCPSQARVQVPWADATGAKWLLVDLLTGKPFERDGNEMASPGLYVGLGPWDCHFLQCIRANTTHSDASSRSERSTVRRNSSTTS